MQAQRARLEGGRWHFQHGPIEIVIGAEGDAAAVNAAHAAAWQRFETVLAELVAELGTLREPVRDACSLRGAIARRMWAACAPYRSMFITPMAAVAGSVAQELIACYAHAGIARAWVNNGGDIALHLAPNQSVSIGLFADLARLDPTRIDVDGRFEVHAAMPVRGIATSGWRGRSFSLGIADSVTVLAQTAAQADAAATIIANAVNLDDVRIHRAPANTLKDDTDLGTMLVTTYVPRLDATSIRRALQAGAVRARAIQREGLIHAAVLVCQDDALRVDPIATQPEIEVGSVFA